MSSDIQIIGEPEKFYGYITGIGVERVLDPAADNIPKRLFATFEYNGQTDIWEVPSAELFELLAEHLVTMAVVRKNSDSYGCSKLWIVKEEGHWKAFEP